MGEEPRAIEEHIRREREALDRDITELEERYHRATDWRRQIRERPGVVMALAFGVGLVGSMVVRSRARDQRRRPGRQDWEAARPHREGRGPSMNHQPGIWMSLQAALVTAATHQIKEYLARRKERPQHRPSATYAAPTSSAEEGQSEGSGARR